MSFSFYVARRYSMATTRFNTVRLISRFASFVIGIAVCAFFIIQSVFSGLRDFGLSYTSSLDPDLKITAVDSVSFSFAEHQLMLLKNIVGVSEVSPVYVQEVVLRFKQQNKLISLLGVDDRFIDVFAITDQIPVGRWVSSTDDEILLGYGTAIDLGAGLYDYDGFVECMIPKSGVLNPLDPNPFHSRWATNVGLFQISEEIDYNYAFAPIRFVRALTKKDGDIYTELNVKISYGSDNKAIKKEVASLLSDSFLVVEKEALNPALYRMLQTERVAIYLILTLVLIIALFNVVGAVVMMVLDKRDELKTLHGIGMSFSALRKVFFFQGLLISGVGGLIGLFVGVVVVLAQSWGSFVLVPGTQLPYPVVFEVLNVGALLLIWSSLSVLAAWIASAVVRPRLFS